MSDPISRLQFARQERPRVRRGLRGCASRRGGGGGADGGLCTALHCNDPRANRVCQRAIGWTFWKLVLRPSQQRQLLPANTRRSRLLVDCKQFMQSTTAGAITTKQAATALNAESRAHLDARRAR